MIVLTAGDGFSCEHVWPMWPTVIENLTEDTQVIRLGKMGAGNEYIFNAVLDYIYNNKVDYVIVQWAKSDRLDLIIDDQDKLELMNSCPDYFNNNYTLNSATWWLSSASKKVKNIIGLTQSKVRTKNYILALEAILEKLGIAYSFFSTYRCDVYPDKDINWGKWIDILGMQYFSLKPEFRDVRTNNVQPSTYVQEQYVLTYMKDRLPLKWKKNDIQ